MLANDNDPDGLVVITGNVATSQGGAIQFAADGSYTYTPAADFLGTDTVGYTARGPFGSQVSATLSIDGRPAARHTRATTASRRRPATRRSTRGSASTRSRSASASSTRPSPMSGNTVIIDGAVEPHGAERLRDATSSPTARSTTMTAIRWSTTCSTTRRTTTCGTRMSMPTRTTTLSAGTRGAIRTRSSRRSIYLSANPDVNGGRRQSARRTSISPAGRKDACPRSSSIRAQYLAANPDVAAAHIDPLAHFLAVRRAGGTPAGRADRARSPPTASTIVYYLQNNPDVAAARVDPFAALPDRRLAGRAQSERAVRHQRLSRDLHRRGGGARQSARPLPPFGWHEGRDPSVDFDTTAYLAAYPDVAAANINPLVHFLQFGQHEGRSPSRTASGDSTRRSGGVAARPARAGQLVAWFSAKPRHVLPNCSFVGSETC